MSPPRCAAAESTVTVSAAGSLPGAAGKCSPLPGGPAGLPGSGSRAIGSGVPTVKV